MQISRRNFVAAIAAAGLVGPAGAWSFAADAATDAPSMTLGFSTYGMKTLSAADAVTQIAKIGYDAVEIACVSEFPTDIGSLSPTATKDLKKIIADSGLRLSALMDNLPLHVEDKAFHRQQGRMVRLCELANELSPQNLPIIETILGGAPGKFEEVRELFARRLAVYEKIIADYKITLAIKPHRMNACTSPTQALALIEQAAPKSQYLKLVYDWSHYALRPDLASGGKAYTIDQSVKEALPKTVFVAAKDVAVVGGKAEFKLPGTTSTGPTNAGVDDQVQVIKALHAAGYTGDVNCEVSSAVWKAPGYDPIAAARDCYAGMADAFKNAGASRARK